MYNKKVRKSGICKRCMPKPNVKIAFIENDKPPLNNGFSDTQNKENA